ncbi:MAG TPA: cell envelope integrity protein TolA [Bacteroidales bacterium]|nr:cell envelope integrity protein TolA [Bacteroidales bacterium]
MPSEKRKGIAGSAIFHGAVFLIMAFFAFTIPPPPEMEEGILVNFGTGETGLGMIEPSSPAVQQDAAPVPAEQPKTAVQDEPLLTQDDEEAPEVKKVDPEAEKRKLEKIEADRKIREQAEADRIRKQQEDAERKRIEAEQQRIAEVMNRTKNALANSKNSGTSSTSEGVAGGTGNQGVPTGSVDSKVRGEGSGLGDSGISYDLAGRGVQRLPQPKYDYQEEGRVVVEVSVDRQGKVVQAIPGTKGSTTLNEYLLKVAKEAALGAQFEANPSGPVVQKGTISYNFILK